MLHCLNTVERDQTVPLRNGAIFLIWKRGSTICSLTEIRGDSKRSGKFETTNGIEGYFELENVPDDFEQLIIKDMDTESSKKMKNIIVTSTETSSPAKKEVTSKNLLEHLKNFLNIRCVLVTDVLLILLFFATVTACSVQQKENKISPPAPSQQWAYRFVKWNDIVYEITDETVDKSNISKVIGDVLANIEKSDVVYGNEEKVVAEKNGDSNYLPVGSKLYEIKGGSTSETIAVEDGETLKKAVNVKRKEK